MSTPKAVGYTLTIPLELYEEIGRLALARNETVLAAVRTMLKLGLLWYELQETGDGRLLLEDAHGTRELVPEPEGGDGTT